MLSQRLTDKIFWSIRRSSVRNSLVASDNEDSFGSPEETDIQKKKILKVFAVSTIPLTCRQISKEVGIAIKPCSICHRQLHNKDGKVAVAFKKTNSQTGFTIYYYKILRQVCA